MSRVSDLKEMSLREEEYTFYQKYRVFCGSFNVNGKTPTEDTRPWIFSLSEKSADIYAIGFQELVELNTTNVIMQENTDKELNWMAEIDRQLLVNAENKRFKLVKKCRMVGLFLVVYAEENLINEGITEVDEACEPTGFMSTFGNKGSVGIRMRIFENRVCFVCSHFAADTDRLEKRNADYRSTKQRMRFVNNNMGDCYDVESHDTVFWFGDLNYRLEKLSLKRTLDLIASNQISELLKFDQLTYQKARGNIFADFNEGEIRFRPTYKYLVATDIYEKQEIAQTLSTDLSESKSVKVKLPSWTDRIFWRSANERVTLVKYSCVNMITISDHKPVFAVFDVELKKIDREKYNRLYDAILKNKDQVINKEMPRISISDNEIKFGKAKFYDIQSGKFSVRNEGISRTNVSILFYSPLTSKAGEDASEPNLSYNLNQWLQINPQHKERIEPGNSFTVELRTNFNCRLLKRLNTELKFEDFLIVRCLNGNDLFVTIGCEYEPTIIGFSLKALSTLVPNSFSPCDSAAMTTEDTPFNQCNFKFLTFQVEKEIEEFEKNLDELWSDCLKCQYADNYFTKEANEKPVTRPKSKSAKVSNDNISKPTLQTLDNMPNLEKNCLKKMRTTIIESDRYFYNDLSTEYTFLLSYMIEKCTQNRLVLCSSPSGAEDQLSESLSQLTLEDQKNLVLDYLSAREFDSFEKANFDVEILAEVLYDLLQALPSPLIPTRYINYCASIDSNYEDALALLDYLPVSHYKLFEYIVKFLQISLQCLSVCNSNYSNTFANAIFKILLSDAFNQTKNKSASYSPNKETYQSRVASKFLSIFIDNHKDFKYVD